MTAKLIVVGGPDKGRAFNLRIGESFAVGRGLNTQTRLNDPTVSRLHCEIVAAESGIVIHNRSSNGTFINNVPVTQHKLSHGDLIRMGGTHLRFLLTSIENTWDENFISDETLEATVPVQQPLRPGMLPSSNVVSQPPTKPLPQMPRQPEYAFLKPPLEPDELGRIAHYRILQLLGEGGMGMVFKAEDSLLQRLAAIKVIKPEHANDQESRQRFLREARAMASIKSDHVVTVYQLGLENEVPFLAMEFLEGETLQKRLDEAKELLPLREIVRVIRETAAALAAAHDRGLVHRDIKPDNLWLEKPHGRVKLLDFGLVRPPKPADWFTKPGWVIGTPDYMSPEQARGEMVDFRCDLYSLGAIFYRLCTGRMPFTGPDALSVLGALVKDEPVPVRTYNPDIPVPIADLIARLMAKSPDKRPPSARVVQEQLWLLEKKLPN